MTIYLVSLAAILLGAVGLHPKKSKKNRKRFMIFSFGIITIVAMLRKYTVGIDLNKYYYPNFIRFLDWSWKDINKTVFEPGFYLFNKLIGTITTNPQVYIAAHALIVFFIYGWFIFKNSDDVAISVFLIIVMNDWFMYMNIMRQVMAIGIVLLGVEILKREKLGLKRYFSYIFIVLIASAFHNSALLMLILIPMFLLNFKRKEIIISLGLIIIASMFYDKIFALVAKILKHRDYMSMYYDSGSRIGLGNVYMICFLFVVFVLGYNVLVINRRKISELELNKKAVLIPLNDSFLLYCILAALMCRILSNRISIMGRVSYYFYPFVWIAIPRVIGNIKNRNNRMIVKYGLLSMAFLMFLYIGYTSADTLFGTVPYEFFWE